MNDTLLYVAHYLCLIYDKLGDCILVLDEKS